MTKDEALTLGALKYAVSKGYGRIVQEMKIAPFTIKYDEALAQPAQEHCQCPACKDGKLHSSDCAAHNGPAYPAGPCDCGVTNPRIVTQWDTPSDAFNDWWNDDYDDSANPFTKDTFAYWAWAGWQAALAQPAQEPWPEEPLGHMAGGVQPPQRKWVDLTPQDLNEIFAIAMTGEHAVHLASDKLKEKNNG